MRKKSFLALSLLLAALVTFAGCGGKASGGGGNGSGGGGNGSGGVVSLSGTIYDDWEETKPLSGVHVSLVDIKGQALRGVNPVTTDDEGKFEFTNLPKNSHVILMFEIENGEGAMVMDVFLNQSQTLTVNPKKVVETVATLEPLVEAFDHTKPYYKLEYYREYREIAVKKVATAIENHINELPSLSELLQDYANYRRYLNDIMTEEVVDALSVELDTMVYKNYSFKVKTAPVNIVIDGKGDEWGDSYIIYEDGLNDTIYHPQAGRGNANYCDIKELHAVKSGGNLYFMITFAPGRDFILVDALIDVEFSQGCVGNEVIRVRHNYMCREEEKSTYSISFYDKKSERETPISGGEIGYDDGSCLEFSLPVAELEKYRNNMCGNCVLLKCNIKNYGEYDDSTAKEIDRLPLLFIDF